MTILKNFDIEALRRERARKLSGGGVDLVAGINQISPEIEKLKVGETARLDIPSGTSLRQFVMSITAKLNNLTPKGGKWEGRAYKVVSDGEKYVYVQRAENVKEPAERKRGNGGGRPRKNAAPAANDGAGQGTERVTA